MIPDRIKISKEFHAMGSGLWLSIEMPIAPGENEIEEFKKGDAILTKAFSAIATPSAEYSSEIKQEMKETNLEAERVEILIDNAETEKELTTYWNSAEKYGLVEMYNKKMEQLSFNQK